MTLIVGIPNAGKTTYSERYANVIHFDEIKGRGVVRFNKVVDMVKENNSLCVEGVYEKARQRIPLVEASKQRNVCIWLDTVVDTCVERERNGRKRSEHMVIWASQRFEPPTLDEGWDEIIIIRGDDEQRISK